MFFVCFVVTVVVVIVVPAVAFAIVDVIVVVVTVSVIVVFYCQNPFMYTNILQYILHLFTHLLRSYLISKLFISSQPSCIKLLFTVHFSKWKIPFTWMGIFFHSSYSCMFFISSALWNTILYWCMKQFFLFYPYTKFPSILQICLFTH